MSAHPLLFSRHHSHPLHLLRRAPFPDCLFPFFLKINPSQARDASLPTRSPSTSLSGCARIRGREQQHDCWSCCSLLRHLHLHLSPAHPSSSLPGWPTETRHRARSRIPTLLVRSPQPQGDLWPDCSGRRPGQARPRGRGPEETQERLWPRRQPRAGLGRGGSGGSGLRGRGSPARPPARSPGLPAKAQETPPPRLGSIQTVTAAASPPLPPAAAPRVLRLPAAPLDPLAPRAFPNSAGGRRGSARPEPGPGWPGGRGLRLTHGAAVDAPLLGSSGSRTDRHPLPLRDQPRRGAAAGFSKATYADSAA